MESVIPLVNTIRNTISRTSILNMAAKNKQRQASRPSSDLAQFRSLLSASRHLVILTGAGVSAESGVPTFRGAGGFWRRYQAQDLASPTAFAANPGLVWEFYHYRRELMASKLPNPAHEAIAAAEQRFRAEGRELVVITQNIDGLHARAGSSNILELHGNLFKVRCTRCEAVTVNTDSPICEALRGRGAPEPGAASDLIPEASLPRCGLAGCGGLLRPHVVWFGEGLEEAVLEAAHSHLQQCDLCLVVGTSSIVYPAAMFAPQVHAHKRIIATDMNTILNYKACLFSLWNRWRAEEFL